MTATVYALTRGGTDEFFYVGCTADRRERLKRHRHKRTDDTIQLVPLATYSTIEAAYRAERIAWESLSRLGAELENARPSGLLAPGYSKTDEQRRESARKARPSQTSEWHRKGGLARVASLTAEERRASARNAHAAMTPEARRERARKAGLAASAARRAQKAVA